MIRLISRKKIGQSKPIIAAELAIIQRASYDEETRLDYQADQEEQIYLGQFDFLYSQPIGYTSYYKVFGLAHADINSFTTRLTEKLAELFNTLQANQFYLLAHLKLDIFGNRNNPYLPLRKAYQTLEQIVGASSYQEALVVDLVDLPQIIDPLFWITRCNSSAEYFFIFDAEERFCINLCAYGNLHYTAFNRELLPNETLAKLGWICIDGPELDPFSTDGKIQGRQINL